MVPTVRNAHEEGWSGPDSTDPVGRLERIAVGILRSRRCRRVSDDTSIHMLDASELAAVRTIGRRGVVACGMVGVLAAIAGVTSDAAVDLASQEGGPFASWPGWGRVPLAMVPMVVAVSLEFVLLYRITLDASHRMAAAVGAISDRDTPERDAVLGSLVRAALEVPISRRPLMGIDPLAASPRWMVWAAALLYKGKVALTNMLLRLLLRRMLGRVAIREFLPLVALPVSGAWDAWLCWKVLRDARLRLFARSLVHQTLVGTQDLRGRDPAAQEAAIRAVACLAAAKRAFPEGLQQMLRGLLTSPPVPSDPSDPRRLRTLVEGLVPESARAIHSIALLSAVCDGRCGRRERQVVEVAFGWSPAEAKARLASARGSFVRGLP